METYHLSVTHRETEGHDRHGQNRAPGHQAKTLTDLTVLCAAAANRVLDLTEEVATLTLRVAELEAKG